jgi:hypothetical protein
LQRRDHASLSCTLTLQFLAFGFQLVHGPIAVEHILMGQMLPVDPAADCDRSYEERSRQQQSEPAPSRRQQIVQSGAQPDLVLT